MKTTLTIICIFLMTLFACKKQVEKDMPEFIGEWHAGISDNDFIVLSIYEDSYANYMIYWQGKETNYDGTARANDNRLTIGRTKYFDIIEYPHLIDTTQERYYITNHDMILKLANWKMVLYGMRPKSLHVCGTRTFYKADY